MGIRYLSKNVNIWKPDISVGDNRWIGRRPGEAVLYSVAQGTTARFKIVYLKIVLTSSNPASIV